MFVVGGSGFESGDIAVRRHARSLVGWAARKATRDAEAPSGGRLHHDIADRTADLALVVLRHPQRLLDVGCGTGYLLRSLASRRPDVEELVATASADDDRLRFSVGVAERLPYSEG
jgi:SAM-dependent methyltransferase